MKNDNNFSCPKISEISCRTNNNQHELCKQLDMDPMKLNSSYAYKIPTT